MITEYLTFIGPLWLLGLGNIWWGYPTLWFLQKRIHALEEWQSSQLHDLGVKHTRSIFIYTPWFNRSFIAMQLGRRILISPHLFDSGSAEELQRALKHESFHARKIFKWIRSCLHTGLCIALLLLSSPNYRLGIALLFLFLTFKWYQMRHEEVKARNFSLK